MSFFVKGKKTFVEIFRLSKNIKTLNLLELFEERLPLLFLSSGSPLHGISQPRQNLDHGHSAHMRPPSLTARNVNGNS